VPDWKSLVARHLDARGIDHTRHFQVVEELAQHLDDRHRALTMRGGEPAAAEATVLQELAANDDIVRELRLAERAAPPKPSPGDPSRTRAEGWWQDLRYAARSLRGNPGFTAVAAITLALGVGANTAIFSVINAVMLRPLPYAQSDRLVRLWESNPPRGWPQFSVSHPNFLDWRARTRSWQALAAESGVTFTMAGQDGAQIARGSMVSVDFLPALGVTPALGRNMRPEEDRPGGHTRVAILADGFWRRVFGGDPSVLGRAVALNGNPYTVIGVLPATFEWGSDLDLLVPLAADPARSRGDHRLIVIGRLNDGVSLDEAHAELATIAADLARQYPESNEGWSVRLASFYDWLIPLPIRDSLTVLLAAVALLLLIACGNVANLLLARGAARQKELSVRTALGASRARLVRQLLLESGLLALLSAALGVAVTIGATRLVVAFGPGTIPRLDEVSVDGTVLAFAIVSALAAAVVFGLAPAVQTSRQDPAEALHAVARGSTGSAGRQRLRAGLTVAEVALSVTLLIGAGLLLRSFARLQQVDPGFDPRPLMTMRVTLPATGYEKEEQRTGLVERLLTGIAALPGIEGAASASGVPLLGGNTSTELQIPDRPALEGEAPSADWRVVSPGYFAAMGIDTRGRAFDAGDRRDTTPVTVISEAAARRYWPGQDPIGRSVIIRSLGNRSYTIIGVANDVYNLALDTDPRPTVYLSTTTVGWVGGRVLWRAAGDPSSHVPAIRDVVRRLEPRAAISDLSTLEDGLARSVGPRRFNLYLLGAFAGVALALAAIGLFGVMAYLVSQRTREIGVRLALGASRRAIFGAIVGRGMVLASLGAAIGVGAAFWLTRAMTTLLYAVSATDPATFAAVPLLLLVIALLACYVPARRAMRVDPVTALRAE
jgi:putative ABC transport system permease protein